MRGCSPKPCEGYSFRPITIGAMPAAMPISPATAKSSGAVVGVARHAF
jgi:hypothetical protein